MPMPEQPRQTVDGAEDRVPGASASPTVATHEPSPTSGLGPSGECQLAGPWSISDVRYRWDMVDRRNVYDANGEFVCMLQAPYREPSIRDRLIVACPSLLAALEKSAVALDEAAVLLASKGLQGCGSIMTAHADIARDAIRKATTHD